MTKFTVYDPGTGRILRSGMADRPEWHLRPGEALLRGVVAPRRGYHVENGQIVRDEVKDGADS